MGKFEGSMCDGTPVADPKLLRVVALTLQSAIVPLEAQMLMLMSSF